MKEISSCFLVFVLTVEPVMIFLMTFHKERRFFIHTSSQSSIRLYSEAKKRIWSTITRDRSLLAKNSNNAEYVQDDDVTTWMLYLYKDFMSFESQEMKRRERPNDDFNILWTWTTSIVGLLSRS